MASRRKSGIGAIAFVSLAVILTLTACQQTPDPQLQTAAPVAAPAGPAPVQSASAPTPPTPVVPSVSVAPLSSTSSRTVSAHRGSITETVWLNGRVSGSEEAPLAYALRSTPVAVLVRVGDSVVAGQILVQADSRPIEDGLRAAQDQLDSSLNRSDLSQRQAVDRQRQVAAAQQDGIAAATDSLHRAQDDYATIAAGASDLDKQAADVALTNARAALQKAQADQTRLKAPPSAADIQVAQQAVVDSQVAERLAAAEVQKLAAGPSPLDLGTAQQQVADAQLGVTTAQSELDRLSAGPDPAQLRGAQREVDRARAGVDAASAQPKPDTNTVNQAKLALQDAQDRLTALKQPPSGATLDVARNRVDAAKANAATADDRLARLTRGADAISTDTANAALGAARLKTQQAQDALSKLNAGPSQEDVQAAEVSLQNARLAFDTAQARRDDMYNRPTQAELRDAQTRVAAAQAALDKAARGQSGDAPADDQTLVNAELDKLRATVADLQSQLEATRLRAPFSGHVISVTARANEVIEAGTPAVVLAGTGEAIVQAALPATKTGARSAAGQTSEVASGLSVLVQIDGSAGPPLIGVISSVTTNPDQAAVRIAQVQVDWGAAPAAVVGSTALVRVAVREHPDALIVPAGAIRMAAGKPYVELVDQQQIKIQPVTIGVSTETDSEIVSGLTDGQLIMQRQSGADAPVHAAS